MKIKLKLTARFSLVELSLVPPSKYVKVMILNILKYICKKRTCTTHFQLLVQNTIWNCHSFLHGGMKPSWNKSNLNKIASTTTTRKNSKSISNYQLEQNSSSKYNCIYIIEMNWASSSFSSIPLGTRNS